MPAVSTCEINKVKAVAAPGASRKDTECPKVSHRQYGAWQTIYEIEATSNKLTSHDEVDEQNDVIRKLLGAGTVGRTQPHPSS